MSPEDESLGCTACEREVAIRQNGYCGVCLEDLRTLLNEAANESSPCQRVLRHIEGRHVATRAEDFYAALKRVPDLVVRLECERVDESLLPIDCRYRERAVDCRFREGAVEFTHEHRSVGVSGRDQLVGDIRDADSVVVLPHSRSKFAEMEAADRVRADGGAAVVEDSYGAPAPAAVDGVNLKADGCPVCGHDVFNQFPAGHYHCDDCQSAWSGDPENASLQTYFGPSPEDLDETNESLPVDIDGKCRACFVNPRAPDSRHCEGCHETLVADGGRAEPLDDDAESEVVECLHCPETMPEDDAVYIDGIDGVSFDWAFGSESHYQSEKHESGPFCSVTCGIHGGDD